MSWWNANARVINKCHKVYKSQPLKLSYMVEDKSVDIVKIHYVLGRIEALAGTVRYNLSDEIRQELREIGSSLRDGLGKD